MPATLERDGCPTWGTGESDGWHAAELAVEGVAPDGRRGEPLVYASACLEVESPSIELSISPWGTEKPLGRFPFSLYLPVPQLTAGRRITLALPPEGEALYAEVDRAAPSASDPARGTIVVDAACPDLRLHLDLSIPDRALALTGTIAVPGNQLVMVCSSGGLRD